jgi:chloride channel protein, CIC family
MGGLAIGVLLLVVPEVMGVGYEYVDQALNGGMLWHHGGPARGEARGHDHLVRVGKRRRHLRAQPLHRRDGSAAPSAPPCTSLRRFRRATPAPTRWSGMGTLFAGIIRAPMTSVFMIFEITQDYQILVPLMVANLIAFWISRRYQPTPVYHALLQQDGVHLPSAEAKMQGPWRTARDLLDTGLPIVDADATLEQAWELLHASGASAVLVRGPDDFGSGIGFPVISTNEMFSKAES